MPSLARPLVLTSLLAGVFAASVQAQAVVVRGEVASSRARSGDKADGSQPPPDEFNFDVNDTARLRIKAVKDTLKNKGPKLARDEWDDIIHAMQGLLDNPVDKLVEVESVDARGKVHVRKVSLRLEVTKVIGDFDKKGRDFYQLDVGPQADAKLRDALEKGDYSGVDEVSWRFFHTKSGAAATALLGRWHLDRGRYENAVHTLSKLINRGGEESLPPEVLFIIAFANRHLAAEAAANNDTENAQIFLPVARKYWDLLVKQAGNKREIELVPGGKKIPLKDLEIAFNRPAKAVAVFDPKDPFMPRGASWTNNAQGEGDKPFLDADQVPYPLWPLYCTDPYALKNEMPPSILPRENETKEEKEARLENEEKARIRIEKALKERKDTVAWITKSVKDAMTELDKRNVPVIPGFFPVASGKKVIFRTYDGVYCISSTDDPSPPPIKAGDALWMSSAANSLFTMAANSSTRGTLDTSWYKPMYAQPNGGNNLTGILFENMLVGSLSHDGTRVYFVDDIAIPPHPAHGMNYGMGFDGSQPNYSPYNDMVLTNRLVALELETGKLIFKIGGKNEGKKEGEGKADEAVFANILPDSLFLGPPLPFNGKLYVVFEKDRQLQLACIDPSTTVVQPTSGKIHPSPTLVWTQPLGTPLMPMPQDTYRRIQGIQLGYSDNVLVVPTNAGAVFGVDVLSHSLLWARSYKTNVPHEAIPNQQQMQQLRMRGGGFNMVQQGNSQYPLDHWHACAPIIVEGKVIFTSWDSNNLMCLNLHDGELIWEKSRGTDDLYIAGVFGNRVMIVGKSAVRFLDLNRNGEQIGQILPIGLPSGIGTAGKNKYYLPVAVKSGPPERKITTPEVVEIDVRKGEITARTKSRKNIAVGNLMFYDGKMYSQTPTGITAFPQLSIKIAEMKKRFENNKLDPVAWAEMGDLMLDDGKLLESVAAYEKSLANKPSVDTRAKAREKLYEAITELLQKDFDSGEKFLDRYKELCKVEIEEGSGTHQREESVALELQRTSNYLSLVAKGKERQGKLAEAFDNYMAFGALIGNQELISVVDQPATEARPDVWARGRINNMMAHATPAQRKPLEDKAAKEWEEVKKIGNLNRIEAFVKIFGSHFTAGAEARLLLAERLIATGEEENLRQAESELLCLRVHESKSIAAQATEALARLYLRKGMLDDAGGMFSDLDYAFADVKIRDGKTGRELFNDLATDKRFLPFLEPATRTWGGRGKLKATDTTGGVNKQGFTIDPDDGDSLPFFRRNRIAIEMNNTGTWSLKLFDRVTGEEKRYAQSSFPAPFYINNYPQSNNHKFAQIHGHLLLLNLCNQNGDMVYAFHLGDGKKLWERNLFGKQPMVNGYNFQQIPYENEHDGVRLTFPDGWSSKEGHVAAMGANYVCLLARAENGSGSELIALDPNKGSVLWKKTNVSARTRLSGDDDYIFLFESNPDGGVTSARCIRAEDGFEIDIPDSSAVFSSLEKTRSIGRQMLVFDESKNAKIIRLYDLLTGKDAWKKELAGNVVLLRSLDPSLVGYVTEKGEVGIFRTSDGKELFLGKLNGPKEHMAKVTEAYLLVDRERFYIALQKTAEAKGVGPGFNGGMLPANSGMRTLSVNGPIYCFDRSTKKRLWFTEEQFEDQQIVLEQFRDLPVFFASNYTQHINGGMVEFSSNIVVLNKKTGAMVFRKKLNTNGNGALMNIMTDPKTGAVDLSRTDMKIRITSE